MGYGYTCRWFFSTNLVGIHMNENIKKQFELLKVILDVGQVQIISLEGRLLTPFDQISTTDKQEEAMVNEATYMFICNFWQQYEFIVEKIKVETDIKKFQFYIPLVRILFENYTELLYFVNQDRRKQIGIFTSNHLLRLADFYRFIAAELPTVQEQVKKEYNRIVLQWEKVLSRMSIIYPEIDKLGTKSVEKMGFNFPSYELILKSSYFKSQSSDTFDSWSSYTSTSFYDRFYRSHSLYAHPSYTNQWKASTSNEMYWIIQFLYLIGGLMVELGNKGIFNPPLQSEYDAIKQGIIEVYPKLLEEWERGPILLQSVK